ncbi:MAG: hypothetical protein JXR32_04970 [Anaerolineaceae bacterium]|nr:hypothetical protein [Anaerolineaceae bacterium]
MLNSAKDFVAKAVQADRSITAVYLTGSMLSNEPLLAGTTDIDLVFIHDRIPAMPREIHRFTDEITLDLYHYSQDLFEQPRQLRVDPILGPAINETRWVLHDSQHWFEYTQAIITAQFDRPDHHAARLLKMTADARSEWWKLENKNALSIKDFPSFLKCTEISTNALMSISGIPLTPRRFFLSLAERSLSVNNPQISLALASLLGFSSFDFSDLEGWIHCWQTAMASSEIPGIEACDVHPHRKLYYINPVKAWYEEGQLESCLWIMLYSWTSLFSKFSSLSSGTKEYPSFLSSLGFDKTSIKEKFVLLDSYLDQVDDIINAWVSQAGA